MPSTTILSPAAASAIALLQRLQKSRLVRDHVVRRKHSQHRGRIIPLDQECRQSARRSRVPRDRLLDDLVRGTPVSCSAISCARNSLVITHVFSGCSQRLQPLHRLLDHRALAIERQHLLGARACGSGARIGFRCLRRV